MLKGAETPILDRLAHDIQNNCYVEEVAGPTEMLRGNLTHNVPTRMS
jgi:hypothetical protein